jgi:hypothetical protein
MAGSPRATVLPLKVAHALDHLVLLVFATAVIAIEPEFGIARWEDLDALLPDAPRVLLSTGKLVGEGFDHPPLDTLVLAMPVSWRGTLQQYAGRLHREHASKTDVRIIDFVDTGYPALLRMWDKRQRGYRAMGYRIGAGGSPE